MHNNSPTLHTLSQVRRAIIEVAVMIVHQSGYSGTPFAFIAGVAIENNMLNGGSITFWGDKLVNENAWMCFTEMQMRDLLKILHSLT